MTQEQKAKIKDALIEQKEIHGQNTLAKRWGISSGMLSHVVNDKWENIGDTTWKKLNDVLGLNNDEWQTVETKPSKFITNLLEQAQYKSNVYAMISPAGSSKSDTTKQYASSNGNVYRIECGEYWNKKAFMVELLRAMGQSPEGMTIYDIMESIQNEILKVDRPLIILDEADKLRDEVFYFFITLYNKLQDKCGILLCATNFLQHRIQKGLKLNKKGYQEIYSRIGRRFIEVPAITGMDITNICKANGVEHPKAIEQVIKECQNDLRRVRRSVEAIKLRNEVKAAA